jgi:hypothetical protein
MAQRALTPQEKKQYLLAKYTKRDYNVNELKPKYAVYFNPAIDKIKDWTLICVTETLEQAKFEILFRKKYIETGDGDLVVENDPRFSTWKNELLNVDKNGNSYEPGEELMKMEYNVPGGMLQVIANSAPTTPASNGFKGIAAYTSIDLNEYKGYYKITEYYEV